MALGSPRGRRLARAVAPRGTTGRTAQCLLSVACCLTSVFFQCRPRRTRCRPSEHMKNGTGWICVLASRNMFRRVLEQVMKGFRAASWWYQTSLQVACSATGQRLGIQPTNQLVCRPRFPTSSAERLLMPLADMAQTWPSTQDPPLAHPKVTQLALCTLPSHGRLTAGAGLSPRHPATRCALI